MTLATLRGSALALIAAVAAWSGGCATAPPPVVDSAFATGAYTPARIAVLPPDVFVVLDQVGENDPAQSAALGQTMSEQTVHLVEQSLRARGYDVDLRARWDGIAGSDGSLLVSRDELGWLANGVLQFGNGLSAGQAPQGPGYVTPELAAKVGWATQSDALLYVNVKGVETTSGKRTASVLAGVFFVVIVAAVVLMLVANSKGGGGGGSSSSLSSGGFRGQSVGRAPAPSGGGFRGVPSGGGGAFRGAPGGGAAAAMPSGSAMARPGGAAAAMPSGSAMSGGGFRGAPGGGAAAAMPSGSGMSRASTGIAATPPSGGAPPIPTGGGAPGTGAWRGGAAPARSPGYVYDGRPRPGFGVGFGVGVVVPLDGPTYTHDGDVQHEDEMFAGDQLYVSMTLVSTYDGRVLWHARQELDLDANDPQDVDRMVQSFLSSLPPRGGYPAAPPPRH